jgi:hypothetical protein
MEIARSGKVSCCWWYMIGGYKSLAEGGAEVCPVSLFEEACDERRITNVITRFLFKCLCYLLSLMDQGPF